MQNVDRVLARGGRPVEGYRPCPAERLRHFPHHRIIRFAFLIEFIAIGFWNGAAEREREFVSAAPEPRGVTAVEASVCHVDESPEWRMVQMSPPGEDECDIL